MQTTKHYKLKKPIGTGDKFKRGIVKKIIIRDDRHFGIIVKYRTVPDKLFYCYID
jgi:hypothetical protein